MVQLRGAQTGKIILTASKSRRLKARGNPGGKEITMDEIKLKLCPFCGSSVGIIGRPLFATPMIVCTNQHSCGAALSFVGVENEAEVIERWNERKENGK